MRRMTIITALFLALGVSSGAWGKDDGARLIPIDLFRIDTANFVSTDVADKVNDSILFTSITFGVPADASDIIIRLLRTTADTVMDGGGDSIAYDIQTKYDHSYDSTWMRIGGSTKCAESAVNTLGGSTRIVVPVDSLKSFGDVARLRLYYITEEDSLRAHDATGLVPLNAKYAALVRFKFR